MENAILWLLTVILSVIFTIVANEPIHFLLARLLGPWIPRKPRGVKGLWEATFLYETKGKKKSETHVVEFRQFGNYVVGKSLKVETHRHRLSGKVRNETYFTGIWESISEGTLWHGAFQFLLSNSGDHMEGQWIGFDSRRIVQAGPWKWTLLSRSLKKKDKESVLKNWEVTGDQLENFPSMSLADGLGENASYQRITKSSNRPAESVVDSNPGTSITPHVSPN